MKKILPLLLAALLLCTGCGQETDFDGPSIAATTAPVYQFTTALCQGTDITVTQVITESVSCVHDYTLTVRQMQTLEGADAVVISGAGLEAFMEDVLEGRDVIDSSQGIELLCSEHDHEEEEDHHHDHDHGESDPHIWLDPANAMVMAQNICRELSQRYPGYTETFQTNQDELLVKFQELEAYGQAAVSQLASREIITFHDGFGYFAPSLDLEILAAIEEEPGSEASAAELESIITLVRECGVSAIFTEVNGSDSAAGVISRETGVSRFTLDMGMSGADYFDLMRTNYDTIKEALG